MSESEPGTAIGFSSNSGFELAQRVAKAFASSTLVPKEFQGNIANCMIAAEMATRIGVSPLMAMQNLHVIQGKPSWSAKFLIAAFNGCGRFTSIRYEWQGERGAKDWGCRAWATEKSTGERIQSSWVTWEIVEKEGWNKKSGSKWLTMPEHMFSYRSAAWLVNTHAPELSMGLSTSDEVQDIVTLPEKDITPERPAERTSERPAALQAVVEQAGVDTATGEVLPPGDDSPI